MARKKQDQDAIEEGLRRRFNTEMLTVQQVALVTGYTEETVRRYFDGWIGKARGLRISIPTLARQLCT